jgi:hypothetical protein
MTDGAVERLAGLIRRNQPCVALTGAGVSTDRPRLYRTSGRAAAALQAVCGSRRYRSSDCRTEAAGRNRVGARRVSRNRVVRSPIRGQRNAGEAWHLGRRDPLGSSSRDSRCDQSRAGERSQICVGGGASGRAGEFSGLHCLRHLFLPDGSGRLLYLSGPVTRIGQRLDEHESAR